MTSDTSSRAPDTFSLERRVGAKKECSGLNCIGSFSFVDPSLVGVSAKRKTLPSPAGETGPPHLLPAPFKCQIATRDRDDGSPDDRMGGQTVVR